MEIEEAFAKMREEAVDQELMIKSQETEILRVIKAQNQKEIIAILNPNLKDIPLPKAILFLERLRMQHFLRQDLNQVKEDPLKAIRDPSKTVIETLI